MLNKHFHYKLDAIAIYEVVSKQNKTFIDMNLEMEIKAIPKHCVKNALCIITVAIAYSHEP